MTQIRAISVPAIREDEVSNLVWLRQSKCTHYPGYLNFIIFDNKLIPLSIWNSRSVVTPSSLLHFVRNFVGNVQILYFLVQQPLTAEQLPSNKSCQYKVSATQYLPISSVVGTGYTIYCSFSYCPLMGTCTPKASLDLYWGAKHPFFSLLAARRLLLKNVTFFPFFL